MRLPIVYAHSNLHTLEALSNQAKLAACCRFWQIWAFQSSSQLSGGVFCVLITSHLAQCTAERAGATGRWGLSWDTQTAVGDRSQGRMQWRKGSQLAWLGWQERQRRGPEIPRGGAEERGRDSSRENSPQAHMAELKHPYAGVKQKIFRAAMLSVSLFLLGCCVLAGLFYFAHNFKSPRNADSSSGKTGMFQKLWLGKQCHGQWMEL